METTIDGTVEDTGVDEVLTESVLGVALTVLEGSVRPNPIFAATSNEYDTPVERPLTI